MAILVIVFLEVINIDQQYSESLFDFFRCGQVFSQFSCRSLLALPAA